MDVDVYWKGRHIARLTNSTVDYYKILGDWVPVGEQVFEQHLNILRGRIAPDGSAMLAITLRFPDGRAPQPARAYIRSDVAPFAFRFGESGEEDCILEEPTRAKNCVRCGQSIERDLLKLLPEWTRCRKCQIELEEGKA